jgi:ASC-1-like (ASCH) protein
MPPRVKTLWIKEEYLQQILEGRKTVEVRVGYPNILRLRAGDLLELNGEYRYVVCRVAHYRDFEELLAHEDAARIAPGLEPSELLRALRSLYPPEKEALGVVALEIADARRVAGTSDGTQRDISG